MSNGEGPPKLATSSTDSAVVPPKKKRGARRKRATRRGEGFLWCPNCKEEMIDFKYLDYYGGVCQKCGYDFYTGWIFP